MNNDLGTKSYADMVREFDTAMGGNPPPEVGSEYDDMKIGLIQEEHREVQNALYDERPGVGAGEVLKELCDLVYVAVGYALYRGWDFDEAFKRVHESNMSKMGDDGKAIRREDGKVMKSNNYKKAELGDLV